MKAGSHINYESSAGTIEFKRNGPIWITETPDFSSNLIDLAEDQAAGQAGTTITGLSVRPRTVTINGSIIRNHAATRRALLQAVSPGLMGRINYIEDGESWYLEGTPTKTPFINAGTAVQDFQFTFRAAYPYWRNGLTATTDIAGLTALFSFPFSTRGRFYLSEFSQNFYREVTNLGDVPVGIEVRFYARSQVVNPRLHSITAGAKIGLAQTLSAGEEVVISTAPGTKTVRWRSADGLEHNGFRYLTLDSDLGLMLQPGNNLLLADSDENRQGMRVTVSAPMGVRSGV